MSERLCDPYTSLSSSLLCGALVFILGRETLESTFALKIEPTFFTPLLFSFGTVLTLLLLFALPPILKLKTISPLLILRKNATIGDPRKISKIQSAVHSFLNSFLSMSLFSKLGPSFKYGISNIFRYPLQNLWQIIAFSLVLTSAFVLFLIHSDLMESFKAHIPKEAPNFFAINIDPGEVSTFESVLKQEGINAQPLYPVIRGRLLTVNDSPVLIDESSAQSASSSQDKNAAQIKNNLSSSKANQRRVPRLLNLSYVSALPPENEIVTGEWFTEKDKGKPLISIEQGFAERLEIKVGDTLSFQIAEQTIQATVKSIRTVNWDSFNPNFFVLFPPQVIDTLPTSYITSFYVAPNNRHVLKTLMQHFPTVNFINIAMILKQIESLLKTLSIALQALLLFLAIMAGIMLFTSIYAHSDIRKRDALLFRILGASRIKLLSLLMTEFALMGLMTGIISSAMGFLLYLWIAGKILKIPAVLGWTWLGIWPILGMLLISLLGWLALGKITSISPKAMLTR